MYIYIYLFTLHDFGHAQHFSNKFNVRNEFQKVQKWNYHDQCFNLTFEQTHATKMTAQRTEWCTLCTCDYRTYWHLLVELRKYVLIVQLVRWSQLWDVADACFFRAH